MGESVVTLNDANFEEEVLKEERPVLVDFWAAWCGPCRVMSPIVEEIAEEFGKIIKVAKLNVDDNPETASSYGIRSIPTFILFEKGEERKKIIGMKSKREMIEELSEWLGIKETKSDNSSD